MSSNCNKSDWGATLSKRLLTSPVGVRRLRLLLLRDRIERFQVIPPLLAQSPSKNKDLSGVPGCVRRAETVDWLQSRGYTREFSNLSSPGLKRSLVCGLFHSLRRFPL
jgi:hypothetical protein